MQSNIQFVVLDAKKNLEVVQGIWCQLASNCNHYFFLSPVWILYWIKSLPSSSRPQIVIGYRRNAPVLGFILCHRRSIRHGFVFSNALYVNETGSDYLDELTLEYNGFLLDEKLDVSDQVDVLTQTVRYLTQKFSWNELYIRSMSQSFKGTMALMLEKQHRNFAVLNYQNTPSFYVDLQAVRDREFDYLSLLSSNKRSQIKRSIKAYEQSGSSLRVVAAQNVEEALNVYEELIQLHQKNWQEKGQDGTFSNKYVCQFHANFIKEKFSSGCVNLLKICNDEHILGCLYNFVYEGRVYFYQCGFNYVEDNKLRPGITAHYMAILHYAHLGLQSYDFLAGQNQYKSSFATASNQLGWYVIRKKQFQFKIEEQLKQIKRWLKKNK